MAQVSVTIMVFRLPLRGWRTNHAFKRAHAANKKLTAKKRVKK